MVPFRALLVYKSQELEQWKKDSGYHQRSIMYRTLSGKRINNTV